MKTNLQDISPVRKNLMVEIEADEVDRRLNRAFRDLAKKARVPGFRPGRIPRSILETRFGDQIREDVARSIISETFPKALAEVGAEPIGAPALEKQPLRRGEVFKYSATLEVPPTIPLPPYLELEVEREKATVSDEAVERELEEIRKVHGTLKSLDELRPIQEGDLVMFDYQAFEADSPIEDVSGSNFMLKIGSGNLHPRFETAMVGRSVGEEARIAVTFEENYFHPKLAGKDVVFEVKILDIKRMILPELNDDFAQSLGEDFKGLEDLKEQIRESLLREAETRAENRLKERLLEQIASQVEIDLPSALVDEEIRAMVDEFHQRLKSSGSSLEKVGVTLERLQSDFRPAAENRVRRSLILAQIAKQEGITVSEAELEQGFADLAISSGQPVENIKKYYESIGMVGPFRARLLEQKTLNYLVQHAKVSEVDAVSEPERATSSERE